jgi:hypothetical protein
MNKRIACLGLLLTLSALAGCKAIALPFMMWGEEPTKLVPAESKALDGKKTCIAVWADSDTLFEFPNARLEIASFVEEALKGKVPKIATVGSRSVHDAQKQDPDWDRLPPAKFAARFRAERLLLIELTMYTTREPSSPHLYRGRISANIKVYDVEQGGDAPLFKTVVETVHPKDMPGEWGSTDTGVRRAAMEAFAADVAGRFHERKVKQ